MKNKITEFAHGTTYTVMCVGLYLTGLMLHVFTEATHGVFMSVKYMHILCDKRQNHQRTM